MERKKVGAAMKGVAKELRERGWTVIPGMAIRETFQPYCKCIATIRGGRITRLYWMPASVPQEIKRKIAGELEGILQ